MPSRIFAGESDSSYLYKIGMVGVDAAQHDTSGAAGATKNVFTGILKTERFYPAGPNGLCFFRQLALRVWRTGTFSVAIKVWVDDKRTQVYATDGSASDQLIIGTGSEHATVGTVEETRIEAGLRARGTSIQVELTVDSDDVSRIFLPETLEIHYLPLRAARRDIPRVGLVDQGASLAAAGVSAGIGWSVCADNPFLCVVASSAAHGLSAGVGSWKILGAGASSAAHGSAAGIGCEHISAAGASSATSGSAAGVGQEHISAAGASLATHGLSAGVGSWRILGAGASLATSGISAGIGRERMSAAGASLAAKGISAGIGLVGASAAGASLAAKGVSAGIGLGYLLSGEIASVHNTPALTRGVAYVWR